MFSLLKKGVFTYNISLKRGLNISHIIEEGVLKDILFMEVRVLEWKKGLEMFSLSKKGSYSAHSSEKLGLKMLIPSKNSVYFQHISAYKFKTTIGIMLRRLLSS